MSNKKISEESIIDAAQLLRKGAKMLSYYCPECKFPLFEAENKVFCPNCEREVKIEKKEEKIVEKEVKEELKISEKVSSLDNKLESAISKVCDLILSAKSAEEVKALSESLDRLVGILEKVKKH
ncbi:MAG: Sjogren's syndrome/scleroderma autoantigen 1 family protein [Archaeoglobales archaeon]|nr:Sjogren's syndrome/scleroderma autoantigen 1 family protein [Archaeoglobales archaeon]